MTTRYDKAIAFHALHRRPGADADGTGGDGEGAVLVLANAWDAASARIIEEAGAPAIATTSAGAAWSLGLADGGGLGRERAVGLVARVAAAVAVPVTADIEDGYTGTPEGVGETVAGVLSAGAVGVNIEDTHRGGPGMLRPVAEQAERLTAARAAAGAAGIPLFLNARVDTYLRGVGDPAARLGETLERAAAYVAAGADGIFVPGVVDEGTVARLARELAVPLNVLARPGAPSTVRFGRLGVARVSVGPSIAQAAYALARRAARELLGTGTYASLDGMLEYAEANALLPDH